MRARAGGAGSTIVFRHGRLPHSLPSSRLVAKKNRNSRSEPSRSQRRSSAGIGRKLLKTDGLSAQVDRWRERTFSGIRPSWRYRAPHGAGLEGSRRGLATKEAKLSDARGAESGDRGR
jgi:hypothetical protein